MREKIILFLLTLILFWGGLNIHPDMFAAFAIPTVLLIFFLSVEESGHLKIKIPRYFWVYGIFLATVLITNLLHSHTPYNIGNIFLSNFILGTIFWLAAYNIKNPKLNTAILKIVILLGGIFAIVSFTLLALMLQNTNLTSILVSLPSSVSLVIPLQTSFHHQFIGDYWEIVILAAFYFASKKDNWKYWALIVIGFVILIPSQSRSALLALAIGIILLKPLGNEVKIINSKISNILLVILAILFVAVGIEKPTIFSRIYFIKAIYGFIQHPLGIGMGNFWNIDSSNHISIFNFYAVQARSLYTHNIILEIILGLGIFSLPFLIWITAISISLLNNSDQNVLIYRSIFFVILINFLFTQTYINPAMFCVMFINLGLAQKEIANCSKMSN